MSIIWLASYPRSGNTWLRFLLQAYLRGGDVDSVRLNSDIPDIHRKADAIDSSGPDATIVKTHHCWSPSHPHADQTRGFIYVLRHPKDVLLSFLAYRKLGQVLPPDNLEMDRRYAMYFCRSLGDYMWTKSRKGTWPEHVASWLHKPAHPHAVVRYENLLSTPEEELAPVLDLMGLPIDQGRLRAAIEACRFSSLREAERKEKQARAERRATGSFFEGHPELAKRGIMFMNEGKAGRTLHHLSPEIDDAFNFAFSKYLEPLGYGPTARSA